MKKFLAEVILMLSCVTLTSCGQLEQSDLLGVSTDAKVACTKDSIFKACLGTRSDISDTKLASAINDALEQVNSLFNNQSFQEKIRDKFSQGSTLVGDILDTNYIVTLTTYCEKNGDTLAKATVGGAEIFYNQCLYKKNADGTPNLAHVSGVLAHEISHNIGYNHGPADAMHTSVPYVLGDMVEKEINSKNTEKNSRSSKASISPLIKTAN